MRSDATCYGNCCYQRDGIVLKYSDVYDANTLYSAFNLAKRGSDWKESVQRCEYNILRTIRDLQNELSDGSYRQRPFFEFELRERGKVRHIKSMSIKDRILQRSACDNLFIPAIVPHLIYDNGASLAGKGVDFSRRRLETHLRKYYQKHGNQGYILLVDCSKFFDNIRHEKLIEMCEKVVPQDCMPLFKYLLSTFEIDVSSLSDKEIHDLYYGVFNSLEHAKKRNTGGKKMMPKSCGIGSQISQICGLFILSPVDHYIKTVKGIKYYGRYMDDSYIILESKEELAKLRTDIEARYAEIGLTVNMKKTQIFRIDKGFTWLKTRYCLTDSGRIIKRLPPDTVARTRRKLKKFKIKYDRGEMTFPHILQSYSSWRGNCTKYDAYRTIKEMDILFYTLFEKELECYDEKANETAGSIKFNGRSQLKLQQNR